jgi:hypothetical protein
MIPLAFHCVALEIDVFYLQKFWGFYFLVSNVYVGFHNPTHLDAQIVSKIAYMLPTGITTPLLSRFLKSKRKFLRKQMDFWENRWILKWNNLKSYINHCNFRLGFHFSSFVKLKVSIGLLHIGSVSPLVVSHMCLCELHGFLPLFKWAIDPCGSWFYFVYLGMIPVMG